MLTAVNKFTAHVGTRALARVPLFSFATIAAQARSLYTSRPRVDFATEAKAERDVKRARESCQLF